jgi:hypothetical protein
MKYMLTPNVWFHSLKIQTALIPWRRKLRKSVNFYWIIEGVYIKVVNLCIALSPCFPFPYRHITIEMLTPSPCEKYLATFWTFILSHIHGRLQEIPNILILSSSKCLWIHFHQQSPHLRKNHFKLARLRRPKAACSLSYVETRHNTNIAILLKTGHTEGRGGHIWEG